MLNPNQYGQCLTLITIVRAHSYKYTFMQLLCVGITRYPRAVWDMETSVYHVGEDCFGVKLSLILGKMNSTDRREEKRNFLIQGRRFRRSFKNYCNYRYFMKLSRLLSIVKLGIDVLLSEHLQSRCIDSSMYRYTPTL